MEPSEASWDRVCVEFYLQKAENSRVNDTATSVGKNIMATKLLILKRTLPDQDKKTCIMLFANNKHPSFYIYFKLYKSFI
jgi:hypothetical protein